MSKKSKTVTQMMNERFKKLKEVEPNSPIRESEILKAEEEDYSVANTLREYREEEYAKTAGSMKKGGSVMSRGNKLARGKPTKIC